MSRQNYREKIMAKLLTQLSIITVTNGYYTNVGGDVREWDVIPMDASECPCLIVQDGEDKIQCGHARHQHVLDVEITAVASGSTAVADARKMLGDVYDALGTDESIGGYVEDIDYEGDTIMLIHPETRIAAGSISLKLHFNTEPFDSDKFYHV